MKHDILALANFVKQSIENKTSFKLPSLSGSEFKELMSQLRHLERMS